MQGDEAIVFHREMLGLCPSPHPDRFRCLNNLTSALQTRFSQTHDIETINEAIPLSREALSLLPPSHPDRSIPLVNLADALDIRFRETGNVDDIEEAIELFQEAYLLNPPQTEQSDLLNRLANTHRLRFTQTGLAADIDEAFSLHTEALRLRPFPHPERSSLLNNLASTLSTRFNLTTNIKDLDEAITLHHEALHLRPHPNPLRSTSLNNLALSLQIRFDHTNGLDDLDKAISFHREALGLRPAPDPGRFSSLNNLASALEVRFGQTGQSEDINEAITLHREALSLRPPPHPDRPFSLDNLAAALDTRFSQTGYMEDIDEAIPLLREAIRLQPSPNPGLPISLINLAAVLEIRYDRTSHIEDVDEAVVLHRQAVGLLPAGHQARPTELNNLGSALCLRFDKTHDLQDIEESIKLHNAALELRPAPHPDRSTSLNNLATALKRRFSQNSCIKDIEESIALHREALSLRPSSHPYRPSSLDNLAISLEARFNETGHNEDLEEAITLHREALELQPAPHPDRSISYHHVAVTLLTKHRKYPHPLHLEHALDAYQSSVTYEYSPALCRFGFAKEWIRVAEHHSQSALGAYTAAIKLLPRVITLDLDLSSRLKTLTTGIDGLARNAAASALQSHQYELSVTFLEEGRFIFWAQALQLRTPLAELDSKYESLAKEFRDASLALELGSQREVSWSLSGTSEKRTITEQEASHYRGVHSKWLSILDRIRSLNEFRNFLLPTPFNELQKVFALGPVVILNASSSGCAALVMTSPKIIHVPLPQCNLKTIEQLATMIQIASRTRSSFVSKMQLETLSNTMRGVPEASHKDRLGRPLAEPNEPANVEEIFEVVLKILWTSVVEPIFRSLNLKKTDSPCRLWWCPTGQFSFLPIHAAGIYSAESPIRASDYIISSYTPSIQSLLRDQSAVNDKFKVMVVIQPNTRTTNPLPCTELELQSIENIVPSDLLVKLGTSENSATVKDVLSQLSSSDIVHFACHGKQDVSRPLDSGLILHDGERLKINEIMKLSMPNASLAFLSACETAMGTETLPDEAIHLAASLLFAGFRGVVGTMWSINDQDGPKVAENFYKHLFRNMSSKSSTSTRKYPKITDAAQALHHAVCALRDTEPQCSFQRWLPFIHMGL